jgi:hypothetical protein
MIKIHMLRFGWYLLLSGICATALLPEAGAAQNRAVPIHGAQAAQQLQAIFQQMAQIKLLRADFVQQKRLPSVNKSFKSSGQVVFAQNQGLLWQIQQPVPADLIMTPRTLLQKTAHTQSKISLAQSPYAAVAQLFLQLLRGDQQALAQNFSIDILGYSQNGVAMQWQVVLKPKTALLQQLFERIEATGGQSVQQMVIHEKNHNRTEIVFSAIRQPATPLSAAENALFQLAK